VDFPFEEHHTLLIAPTGWGKTSLILDLLRKTDKKFVFLSPLRALADEFFQRIQYEGLKGFMPESRKHLKHGMEEFDFQVMVITYELIDDVSLAHLLDEEYFFILDEVHLNLMWGRSFRPILLETLDVLIHFDKKVLMLTATYSDEFEQYLNSKKRTFYKINIANYKIKKTPKNIYLFNSKTKLLKHLENIHKETTLVFCQYRAEVKNLRDEYQKKGYNVLSCVSGEVDYFRASLQRKTKYDFIFATSTLSHGVNLPKLDTIIILYPVPSRELWVQMIGRGGRRGEEFNVYQMNYQNYQEKYFLIGLIKWYIQEKLLFIRKIFAVRRYLNS
jgi:ATP-dependent DNA helicase RecQ